MFSWYPSENQDGKYSNDLKTLIDKVGINVFVNLTQPNERLASYEHIIKRELNAKDKFSICINFPIPDGKVPLKIEEVDNLIETLLILYKQNNNMLIHCRGGHGRSGLVSACLMIKMGYTVKQSLQQVENMHKTRTYIPNYPCPDTNEQKEYVKFYYDYLKR